MLGGLLGKKIGMSQVFGDDGHVVPVTVIEAGPCIITQIKNESTDGYQAIQLGFGTTKRPTKPIRGHLKDSQHGRYLREIRTNEVAELIVGQRVEVDIFEPGELVNVIGRSKGRGFAGVMKRHGFSGGPSTHGQSDRARAPGSIGGGTTPGKVYKGMKMAGHMGDERVTAKNLKVIRVDLERNLLLVKGGVPGAPNGLLLIQKTGKPFTSNSTETLADQAGEKSNE
jgi:large subunit ribosomal protein L3